MKRWPIIRHIRFFWFQYRVFRWARMWYEGGIGLGSPNPSDLYWLEEIWKGKA